MYQDRRVRNMVSVPRIEEMEYALHQLLIKQGEKTGVSSYKSPFL